MNKHLYIESMHNNQHILFTMGAIQDERYKCPLCMQSFSDDEVVKNLTEEDVPQASLGGKRIALTCRFCNSTCGHSIDVNLLNAIFVVYTLSKVMQYRVCVFVPSPNVPYLTAIHGLRKILMYDSVRVEIIPSYIDFFNNQNDIARLRQWCYGWGKF